MKADETWSKVPPQTIWVALAHIEVYLDDFIGVIQGGPTEQNQMIHKLFYSIDKLFLPINTQGQAIEEPISLNKLTKVDAKWNTTKTVLGWAVDTAKLVLTLPQTRRSKIYSSLESLP